MSKQLHQASLGFTVLISGAPSSAEEYDQMAGEVGACLAAANDDYVKHNWLSKFRAKLATALVEATGIPRKVVGTRKTRNGEVEILQKESEYLDDLKAAGVDLNDHAALAQKVADSIPFDLSGVATSGRIGKAFLDAADELIEKITAAGKTFERFVTVMSERNPGFSFVFDDEGNPTRESIAFALKADDERARKAAAADRLAAF